MNVKACWLLCFAMGLGASVLLGSVKAEAATIDFEGVAPRTIVDSVSTGAGVTGNLNGFVGIYGLNPALGAPNNAAVVFDSGNPSLADFDLGSPDETCPGGGPGIGIGGELGMPFENCNALGHVLILNEEAYFVDRNNDGVINGDDSPVVFEDDSDLPGAFVEFDFSTTKNNGKGTVTVNSVTIMDVEREEFVGDAIELSGPGIPTSFISVPSQGDNGVVVIDGIGLEGVDLMTVRLNGSGAIASVVVNEDRPRDCWITTGGFHNAGVQAGPKICTFGGNVGPPASGAWQVNDHDTGDKFHTNDVQITQCLVVDRTGPDQPGGKKGFDINRAEFAGTGRLNGVDGFSFTGYVIDAGEPAGKKGNDKDEFGLVATNGSGDVVFDCTGELDGGNVQIHPPVGN